MDHAIFPKRQRLKQVALFHLSAAASHTVLIKVNQEILPKYNREIDFFSLCFFFFNDLSLLE